MKKILLISVALFTTLSMNAQVEKLIYEMDWAGVEYIEWNCFGEAPNASYYKATDEGLAITNPAINDHIWEVRVIDRSSEGHGLSLEEGHDYVVRLTLKVPSDGHIFMQLGNSASSWYDGASVTASDDWQVIDIESTSYYDISGGAHVLLGFGEMVGTTILKKVQVYERITQDTYRPFVEEGKVWKVGNSTTILDNSVQMVDYYYFDGDTIIGGKTCKQMMCQRFVSPDYSNEYWAPKPSLSKEGAWYEENKKVYFYDERKQSMVIQYDFSLAANDTLQFITGWYSPFIIGPKQTGGIEGFKGVYRDIRLCGDEGQSYHDTFWLEGVGCLRGPIRNPCDPIYADPVPEFLMSCVVGDEVIYYNDDREDAATPAGARKNRFDFTHTPKVQPKTRISRGEEPLDLWSLATNGTQESLYGEYNDLQLGINLDPLDDTYLVSITNDSGKVVYEKTINAGNIVGLNIDISAYAKGRYTVTVENSRESFTGEFETLTTGISDAVRLNDKDKMINDKHIYNLQGQRLNRLQKGLNIVNGQKIYIK